jgi:hypothetical protein
VRIKPDGNIGWAMRIALYRSSERTAPLDLANAIRPLAILKEGAGDIEEARRLWEEARDLYAAADVGEGADECSARLERLGHQPL